MFTSLLFPIFLNRITNTLQKLRTNSPQIANKNYEQTGVSDRPSDVGAGRNCPLPMTVPNPSPALDKKKAVAVRNSLLERFSGKFRRCWKMIPRFSGSAKCYPCQGLGTFRQGKRLLENWPRLRERCWIFSSETATAFLSSSQRRRRAEKRSSKRVFWRVRFFSSHLRFSDVFRANLTGAEKKRTLPKTPFFTTVSPHDAFSAPLACSD